MATNEIEREINAAMRECIDENDEILKQRCTDAGKKAVDALKTQSRKRKGTYAKKWKYKVEQSEAGTNCTVYNDFYQLTHLLENDHKITNQTGKNYGTARGDHIIAQIADSIGAEFSQGGDTE